VNWSPDLSGTSTSTLAPAADVIFSVTGTASQNQNTILDANATISSLTVNDSVPVTIGGPGTLTINSSGSRTGITINPGAGRTTIDSKVALVGAAGPVTVHNAAGLLINGAISGTTGLTKAGLGQLTLTGTNTYAGRTTVLGGVLEVDGSIAGNALVSHGLLGGTGFIAGNVTNNALVNPGRASAPGVLSIGGNFKQNPAGTLSLRLASPSSFDSLTIGGMAVLSGALNVSYLDGFEAQPGDSFQILSAADGVSGSFSLFNDAHATGTLLSLQVVYLESAVFLEFVQESFAGVLPDDASPNAVAVADALDDLAATNPDDELIQQLNTLQISAVPDAIEFLSPEDFAAIYTAGLATSQVQIGNLESRLSDVRQGASGFSDSGFAVTDSQGTIDYDGKSTHAPDGKTSKQVLSTGVDDQDHRWGVFISGNGEIGDLESTDDSRGSSFKTGGVTLGADYRINRHLVVGAAFGYANTSSRLNGGGNLDFDSGKGSLYATQQFGGFYLNEIVGVGYSSIDTKRRTFGGFARGQTNTTDFNGLLGTGYDFHTGPFTYGPVASLQYTTIGIDGFTEHGAVGALHIEEQRQDSLKSAVGARLAYTLKVGRVVFTPEIRAQWQHEYLDDRSSIDAHFRSGDSFTVHGPRIGRDSLLLDAGLAVQLNSTVTIFAYYTGELGRENYTAQSVNIGARVSF